MKVVCSILLLVPLAAAADAPVLLYDPGVAQYKAAANAARQNLPGAVDVNPSDPALGSKLSEASVIIAIGQQALTSAIQAAPLKPVVFCMVLGTNATSQNTVTGVPLEADPAVVLAHIKGLTPGVKRVGLIYNRATSEPFAERARAAAGKLDLEIVSAAVSSPQQVQAVAKSIAKRIDVLWLPPDPKLFNREVFSFLLSFTAERKVPLFGFLDSFTEAGALASVSPNYDDIGFRAGKLAASILSRPANERVPVPEPVYAPGKLTVNLKAARALGVVVPSSALNKAEDVYR